VSSWSGIETTERGGRAEQSEGEGREVEGVRQSQRRSQSEQSHRGSTLSHIISHMPSIAASEIYSLQKTLCGGGYDCVISFSLLICSCSSDGVCDFMCGIDLI